MRRSRWQLIWCMTLILLFLPHGSARPAWQDATPPDKLLSVADGLIPILTKIRGLAPKAPIRKGIKSREEISQFIRQQVAGRYEKTELKNEGLLLQKLGLIPSGLDYTSFTLKLLTEQVGGYYDPEKKALFVAGWLSVDEQRPAMVHELMHALQDQYFDLNGMMQRDRKSHNNDMSSAHQAITEGEATAVMLDFMLEPVGRTYLDLPNMISFMRTQVAMMNDQFEVLKGAPDFIKESLVFPYSYGTAFMQQLRSHGEPWSAADKIYANMPASTEQIMHPEKYFGQRDEPKAVKVEDLTPLLGKNWKISYRNTLGEFFLYLLLKTQLPEDAAASAGKGWGGDQVVLLEESGSGRSAVIVESVWDDQESADRFYAAISSWIAKKYPQGRKIEEADHATGVISGGEYCSIRRRGSHVRLVAGLPETYADKFKGR
jgi:hypothetical protein